MPQKILCATDGQKHSQHAVELAATLSAKLQVPLTICTVNVMRGSARGPLIPMMDDAEVKSVLAAAAKLAQSQGAANPAEIDLVAREAAAAIVRYAEENGFDHIVVGTGDKHGVSRLVLGSVAADVSSRAHCTVTVVR